MAAAFLLLTAGPRAGAQRSPAGVEPDWAVVEEYLDELSRSELESVAHGPLAGRAMAAATAILEQDGAHEKTVEAAEFLIEHGGSAIGGQEHLYAGAKALLEHAPGYGDWPQVLSRMDARRIVSGTVIDAFFEELASGAQDPVLRATGRYYVAVEHMRAANGLGLGAAFLTTSHLGPTADTEARRQRALEVATGLSAGVENERFLGGVPHGPLAPMTLAEVEADLIRSIRHGTVGGTLPEMTGKRLDGVEEPLADYRGRFVLLDFWATWCGPCIAALPELRELVAEVPADRFAMIAISVDEELETVTRFMENEPMPWVNWHAGVTSDIGRLLRVVGYPTYVLVDDRGNILARTSGFASVTISSGSPAGGLPEMSGGLSSMVKQAVAGLSPQ